MQGDRQPCQKLPLKSEGVCSGGTAQKPELCWGCPPSSLATTHCCFPLATALPSTLVSQGESEQKPLLFPHLLLPPVESWIFKAWRSPTQPRATVSAKTCLSCARYYTKRTKICLLKSSTETAQIKSALFFHNCYWNEAKKCQFLSTEQPATERTNQVVFLTRYVPLQSLSISKTKVTLPSAELAKILSVSNCACYINYVLKWLKNMVPIIVFHN